MNEVKDFIVYNYQTLLNANKREDYQDRMHLMTKVLVDFLYNNKLLVNLEPYDESGSVKLNLVIMFSNLTEDGVEMFKKPIRNWWSAHDRGTRIDKITILEKGLEKIKCSK